MWKTVAVELTEQQRRRRVLDAVVDLIVEGGIEAASLRNVARRSGLNIGSVRYLYPSADELLVAAIRDMADAVGERVVARAAEFTEGMSLAERGELAVSMLAELLPLDERRTREVTIWLAVMERSRTAPSLRPVADMMIEGPRQIGAAIAQGHPRAELITHSLAAVCDGLAIAMLHAPSQVTEAVALDVLRLQMARLLGEVRT